MADDDRTALFDSIEGDLAGVELALARLDAGAYFTCESCGGELTAAMLLDDPTRSRCARCITAVVVERGPDASAATATVLATQPATEPMPMPVVAEPQHQLDEAPTIARPDVMGEGDPTGSSPAPGDG